MVPTKHVNNSLPFLLYSPIAELQHVASIYGYQPVKVYTHRDTQVMPTVE